MGDLQRKAIPFVRLKMPACAFLMTLKVREGKALQCRTTQDHARSCCFVISLAIYYRDNDKKHLNSLVSDFKTKPGDIATLQLKICESGNV